ncbi:hypothetical protein Pmar_PMAR023370, partial [Perkinsus marinus ATCC 50983]
LKRLVEEYCATGEEVPQEVQPSPTERLLSLGKPLVHALLTLAEDMTPFEASSE